MQISLNETCPEWVEYTNLSGMDHQVLAIDELVRECAELRVSKQEFIRRF